jgi:hypothetical protein
MSTLFDVSPDEPTRNRRPKKPKAEPAAVVAAASPSTATVVPAAAPALGRLDEGVECIDQNCQGTAHDIIEEGQHDLSGLGAMEPAWLVECCFCGCARWTRPIKGHLKPVEKAFLFRDGRFAGMTPAQAALQPRGLDYLRWAAQSHPRPTVREACGKHLDRMSGGL